MKSSKRGGKKRREGRGGKKRGGAWRDRELTCRHLFAGSLAESAAACSHRESFWCLICCLAGFAHGLVLSGVAVPVTSTPRVGFSVGGSDGAGWGGNTGARGITRAQRYMAAKRTFSKRRRKLCNSWEEACEEELRKKHCFSLLCFFFFFWWILLRNEHFSSFRHASLACSCFPLLLELYFVLWCSAWGHLATSSAHLSRETEGGRGGICRVFYPPLINGSALYVCFLFI